MDFPKLHMITAASEGIEVRIFIGCPDLTVNVASWLQMNGWVVELLDDVKKEEYPRSPSEEMLAAQLIDSYNRWNKEATR